MKAKTSKTFDATSKEVLKDPETAALYLEEILADDDLDLFKQALRDVAAARVGSMAALARETQLTREGLYQSFSPDGNPGLDTLVKVLHAAGLRFSIAPAPRASA